MTDITRDCHDDGPHLFLEDGGETEGGVSCALCDLAYETWLAEYYPAIAALSGEARAAALANLRSSTC